MLLTWLATVLGVMAHSRATSLVLSPLAIRTRICRSRTLSRAGAAFSTESMRSGSRYEPDRYTSAIAASSGARHAREVTLRVRADGVGEDRRVIVGIEQEERAHTPGRRVDEHEECLRANVEDHHRRPLPGEHGAHLAAAVLPPRDAVRGVREQQRGQGGRGEPAIRDDRQRLHRLNRAGIGDDVAAQLVPAHGVRCYGHGWPRPLSALPRRNDRSFPVGNYPYTCPGQSGQF